MNQFINSIAVLITKGYIWNTSSKVLPWSMGTVGKLRCRSLFFLAQCCQWSHGKSSRSQLRGKGIAESRDQYSICCKVIAYRKIGLVMNVMTFQDKMCSNM